MANENRVSLVVPCYNEAARIDREAFDTALQSVPWLDFCFVNDGSTDDTLAVLTAMHDAWPLRVRIISLVGNVGKAEAVRQGLLATANEAAIGGFWDADLAAPLTEVAALRALLIDHDAVEWVWGIRLRTLGRRIERRASRHYLGRAFATVVSLVLGVPSYDTQCGAKLFRWSPLLRTVIAKPFASRWIFDVEMLSRADALLRASEGTGVLQRVFEQPLDVWSHQGGSKVRMTDFGRALIELWRIRRLGQGWKRPIADWPHS